MYINEAGIEEVTLESCEFYHWWKTEGRTDTYEEYTADIDALKIRLAWGSHQPVLIHVLNTISNGDVIEFGMGYGSSPLVSTFCNRQGRFLISLENNARWIRRFKGLHANVRLFRDIEILSGTSQFLHRNYTIALVDAHPAGLRQVFLDKMCDKVDYFIVHDTEDYLGIGIDKREDPYHYDFSRFRHQYHFDTVHPTTSLLSNLEEIDDRLLTVFECMK